MASATLVELDRLTSPVNTAALMTCMIALRCISTSFLAVVYIYCRGMTCVT